MTLTELGITVGIAAFGTLLCRTLPFLIFRNEAKTPAFIQWLGEQLPRASMAMLAIYCLREVRFTVCADWVPTVLASIITVTAQILSRKVILAICAGTFSYMVLLRMI